MDTRINKTVEHDYRFLIRNDGNWWTFAHASTLEKLRELVAKKAESWTGYDDLPTDPQDMRIVHSIVTTTQDNVGDFYLPQWLSTKKAKK